ncbi:MAG TPA: esterase, partial [Microbacterium sp.]|nr:esterase [Microbacterium sp.]
AAIRVIREATGAATVAALVHCQGSTSFSLAAAAGLLPDVDVIVSNAVSLHPVIPAYSRVKILAMAPWIARATDYLSPAWAYRSDGYFSRIVRRTVAMTHPECDNLVCRLVSFTYGSGRPALWSHRHLDAATHDWITGEFAAVPMSFFAEMGAGVRAGHLVPLRDAAAPLPSDAATAAPRTRARFALFAGADNRCFLPESQRRTFAHLERYQPGRHSLFIVRGYGHLDVFFGRDAWRDVHPLMVKELG